MIEHTDNDIEISILDQNPISTYHFQFHMLTIKGKSHTKLYIGSLWNTPLIPIVE